MEPHIDSIASETLGRTRCRECQCAAFTLIELLVVLAVVSVMAAILLPVFIQVREKARQMTCASNMRQLGVAFEQYVSDSDDRYPLPGSDDGLDASQTGPYWDLADPSSGGPINNYLHMRSSALHKGNTIWMCPNMPDYYETPTTVPGTSVTFQQLTARTYVMNWFLRDPSPEPDGSVVDAETAYPDTDPATSAGLFHLVGGLSNPLTSARLVAPSDTVLLFEGVPEQGTTPVGTYLGSARRSGDFSFQKGYMPSAATSADVYTAEGIGTGAWQADTAWHNGRNLYLFCDGHVKNLTVKPYPWVPGPNDNIWFVQRYRN